MKKYTYGVREMLLMNDYGNFASELPYFCFLNKNVTDSENPDASIGAVLLTNGSMMVTFEYRGKDLESSTNAELNSTILRLSSILSQLEEGYSLHIDVIREKIDSYIDPSLNFFNENITAKVLEEEGRDSFSILNNNIENKYYFTINYLPPNDFINKVNNLLYTSTENEEKLDRFYLNDFEELKENFYETIRKIVSQLIDGINFASFEVLNRQRMLSFLSKCINDYSQPYHRVNSSPIFLQYLLAKEDVIVDNNPKIGNKYLTCISIYDLPNTVYPGILDEISNLNIEFRFNTRFIYLDNSKAVKELNKLIQKWKTKRKPILARIAEAFNISTNGKEDSYAIKQEMDVESQLEIIQSEEAKYGFYNSLIIIFDEDLNNLKKNAIMIEGKLRIKGFYAKIEDVNNMDAYMGSLPGKTYENVVTKPIFTHQLATLFPITAYWTGEENTTKRYLDNNGKNPVLAYVKTNVNSPFRLTHHADDVGHTMVIGPAGSGKSTFLNFLVSQHARYKDSYVFHFDKGASSKVLCYGYNGLFYDIIKEEEDGREIKMSFQPLYKLETTIDRQWAENWIENIAILNNLKIDHTRRNRIREAVIELSKLKGNDKNKRTMSELHSIIQDDELKDVLKNYTKIQTGGIGEVFDGNDHKLDLNRYTVFEMRQLLLLNNSKYIVPIIEYLFKVIEDKISINSSPTLIILDEAWVFLDNDIFRDKIKAWLKEMRKYNCSVIFATQNLEEAFSSEIASTLFQECPTKILLPNNEIYTPVVKRNYEKLGLNENEINIIGSATPKKHYFIMKKTDRRVIDLGLDSRPALLSLIGQSGIEINKVADTYKNRYGNEFAKHWWKYVGEKKQVNLTNLIKLWDKEYIEYQNQKLERKY